MKTLRILSLALVVLSISSVSSHAKGPRGGGGGKRGGGPQGQTQDGTPRTPMLETATTLQMSTLGPRMTEDEWAKRFPKTVAAPAR